MFRREREEPRSALPGAFEEDRRVTAGDVLAGGSLACSRCDAPVSIGSDPLSVRELLACPFCAHRAPLRDFLSLAQPTRPTRVVVRVRRAA